LAVISAATTTGVGDSRLIDCQLNGSLPSLHQVQ